MSIRISQKAIWHSLLSLSLFCLASCLIDSVALGEENAKPLKSAEELATLLKSRLDAPFTPPTSLSYDVLAAEQRSTKAMIFKSGADWNSPEAIVWEWNPFEAPELTKEKAGLFGYISECKPSSDCSLVLVAASGGGVAIIRVSDKATLFYGNAGGNTHSIELLPNGAVVAASSTGCYISLFRAGLDPSSASSATSETPIAVKYPLPKAHGVVWDGKREILWALGDEFVGYRCVGTKDAPELEEIFRTPLEEPIKEGHDLCPAPGYDALIATGVKGVSVFDPETRQFLPVIEMKSVKSISVDDQGTTLMQRAVEKWWSDSIIYGDKDATAVGKYSGARFYKARWFAPNEFWTK